MCLRKLVNLHEEAFLLNGDGEEKIFAKNLDRYLSYQM
jgi:hypothetical protein